MFLDVLVGDVIVASGVSVSKEKDLYEMKTSK